MVTGKKIIYSITDADENNRLTRTNALCDIVVLYDFNEKEKSGVLIPTEKLESFTLNENIFGALPKLRLKFFDTGEYFKKINFVIGKKLYLKITPRPAENMKLDFVPAPYIETVFTVQEVQTTFQPNIRYNYTLDCTYGSLSFLSKICFWPKRMPPLDITPEYLSSKDVLLKVAGEAGFNKPTSQLTSEPQDKMNWLSTNYTYDQFIKKIVSHSWIDEDDAPFYYVDKNGTFYLSSLRTCGEKAVVGRYMEITKLHQLQLKNKNIESNYRGYAEGSVQNMGFMANDGGNVAGTYVFNPMHTPIMDPRYLKPTSTHTIIPSFDMTMHYRKYTSSSTTPAFVNGLDNRSDASVANMKYLNNAFHFMENHQFYDVAPGHNKALIRRFFQVFADIVYNCNNQTKRDFEENQRVKLSDKINIEFSSGLTQNDTSIHTGDYIVADLTHTWTVGGTYTINIIGVRDTITKEGSLIK